MKIYYRNQLPGKTDMKEFRLDGFWATIVGVLIMIAIAALFIFVILPLAFFGIIAILSLIVLLMVGGYVWLGFKIGWRNMWDLTKMWFLITFGRSSMDRKWERIRKAWDDRTKGRSGEWQK